MKLCKHYRITVRLVPLFLNRGLINRAGDLVQAIVRASNQHTKVVTDLWQGFYVTPDGTQIIATGVSELESETSVQIWVSEPASTLEPPAFVPKLLDQQQSIEVTSPRSRSGEWPADPPFTVSSSTSTDNERPIWLVFSLFRFRHYQRWSMDSPVGFSF